MNIKKQKKIRKALQLLNYPTPYKILVTPQFLKTINKQKHTLAIFNSLLNKPPKLYITECAYKQYKNEHKKQFIDSLVKMSNPEKKKWKKERFNNDFVRHCSIKKCVKEESFGACVVRFINLKKNKFFLACDEDEVFETKRPRIFFKGGELCLSIEEKQQSEQHEEIKENI
ncbi:hypothetical protein COBT_000010 [Conglomerata obtusa]